MTQDGNRERAILGWMVAAFAFFLPITIAVAEGLVFAAIPVWLYAWARRRGGAPKLSPYAWPIACFIAAALVSSFLGVRPEVSLGRSPRLLLLLIPFIAALAFGGGAWARRAVVLFISGCALRGLYDIVRVPVLVSRGVGLYDTGNMRDPQMYMTALCFLLAGWGQWAGGERRGRWAGLVAAAAGLVLHFKRGAWFSFVFAVTGMGVLARKYRAVAAVVLCGLGLLLVPQVRERLEWLKKEWSPQGGRRQLWTRAAPALLRDHPMGMGLGAVKAADFKPYTRGLEPKLNHLHNNVLQIAVELGWAGLAVWLWWMATALVVMYGGWRAAAREGRGDAWMALGALGAFVALLLNGAVEYNFGDSEILMLYGFLMGLSCAGRAGSGPGAPAGGAA